MAENPLLPNAELQALLALTRRCATLDAATRRKGKRNSRNAPPLPFREALLAGTTLQLRPGDLLITEPGDTTAESIASRRQTTEGDDPPPPVIPPIHQLGRNTPRLQLAAAMAAALRQTGSSGIVLAQTRHPAAEPNWTAALAWAQERQLPLILACADPRGEAAFGPDPRVPKVAFSWQSVRQAAQRLKLPVLTIDGEDAVAVYRAMQESVLRARFGAGPAILWAMLPKPGSLASRPRSADPLRRLQRYLRSRKIPF